MELGDQHMHLTEKHRLACPKVKLFSGEKSMNLFNMIW